MSSSLSASWLGARTGLDPGRLEALRRQGRLLGVPSGNGYDYPAWQFGPDGQPLPALAHVLAASRSVGMSDERVAELLNTRAGLGSDRRVGDALRDGNVEHVIAVVLNAR
ncbi:MAG TPA: hypothetical protein VLK36_14215 [Gaiellaceae bacterium]|nr:hypothetical protein [Gaiellaceae bacterium]